MKINVGNQAKVIGTKRVGPQGTVAGLREFAGRDVFIVVPSRTPRAARTPAELAHEAGRNAKAAARRALREYRVFRERHLESRVPGTDVLLGWAPVAARPRIRRADAWVRSNARRLEKQAEAWLRP